jgi:hypothetical protein
MVARDGVEGRVWRWDWSVWGGYGRVMVGMGGYGMVLECGWAGRDVGWYGRGWVGRGWEGRGV